MDAEFFTWLQSDTGREWFERAERADLMALVQYFREHDSTVDSFLVDVAAIERECHPHRGCEELYREFFKGARYLHDARERAKRLTAKLNAARRAGEIFPKGFRTWWIAAWDADIAAGEVRDE